MKIYRNLTFLVLFFVCSLFNFSFDTVKISKSIDLDLNLAIRGYSLNDQRIYWSGMEFTFGSEAVISADFKKKMNWGEIKVENLFFLNQPFGKNILEDEGRKRYHPNFVSESFEISKMSVQLKTGKLTVKIGKSDSPFGRSSFPIFNNNLKYGSPFIRAEAILWRETGVFINIKMGVFSLDIAAVNGEENRDTNSGKAGIFRLGFEQKNWRIGASMKEHDGHGSEWQKLFNSHVGFDMMFRIGNFEFSGEVIWDEYGFHKEFNELDIFWPSSIYYREIFYKYKEPIQGFGWYSNLKIELNNFLINFNYGEYVPEDIGNIYHDNTIKRFILKFCFNPVPEFKIYFSGVLENTKPEEPWREGAKGFAGLLGFEFEL